MFSPCNLRLRKAYVVGKLWAKYLAEILIAVTDIKPFHSTEYSVKTNSLSDIDLAAGFAQH